MLDLIKIIMIFISLLSGDMDQNEIILEKFGVTVDIRKYSSEIKLN